MKDEQDRSLFILHPSSFILPEWLPYRWALDEIAAAEMLLTKSSTEQSAIFTSLSQMANS
jgi:hypothetical protein